MPTEILLEDVYFPSEDIVAREIEGELIIIPITSGIGDTEDDLYTLNDAGKRIWKHLNGTNRLLDIISKLSTDFEAQPHEIEQDVVGLVEELKKRKMIMKVKST